MKRKLLYGIAVCGLLFSTSLQGQCLDADNGLYPGDTFEPVCNGSAGLIDDYAYSSEYSNVLVADGETYTFSSNLATDFLTISNEDGTTAYTSGVGSVTWLATVSGVVRFYTHDDATCAGSEEPRSRIVTCGTAPVCENPIVEVPFSTGFEETDANECLTIEDLNGGNFSGWAVDIDFPTETGDNSMVYTYDSDLPGDDWFFTPGLNLTGGTAYTLSYLYRGGIGVFGYLENMEVKYGTAASAATMTTSLAVHDGIDTSFDSDFETVNVSFTPTTTGVYYIGFRSYSDADQGYIQVDDISVTPSLSTEGFDRAALVLYPNPVNEILTIDYPESLIAIEVYNLLGQKVIKAPHPETAQVDMSVLSAGTYVVKVASEQGVGTVKVVKQ